jgi:hypothetical protein
MSKKSQMKRIKKGGQDEEGQKLTTGVRFQSISLGIPDNATWF